MALSIARVMLDELTEPCKEERISVAAEAKKKESRGEADESRSASAVSGPVEARKEELLAARAGPEEVRACWSQEAAKTRAKKAEAAQAARNGYSADESNDEEAAAARERFVAAASWPPRWARLQTCASTVGRALGAGAEWRSGN